MKINSSIIAAGKKKLASSTIIVCGIVRDCAYNLKRNISTINKFCELAKDYHIVIYENDSVDGTKDILLQWQKEQKNVHVSINDFNAITIPSKSTNINRFFSRSRIEKMAKYRNFYLDYIEANSLKSDYIIVVDLDVKKIFLNGVISSFAIEQEWDAIAANGYIYSLSAWLKKRYNDAYALVESGKRDIPQTEKSIADNQYYWAFLKLGMPIIRVFSAFGGFTIYKSEALQRLKYKVLDNNDERVEVRCEHFSLYCQMADRGFDKVYINPNMRVKYQPYIFSVINNIFKKLKNAL